MDPAEDPARQISGYSCREKTPQGLFEVQIGQYFYVDLWTTENWWSDDMPQDDMPKDDMPQDDMPQDDMPQDDMPNETTCPMR